MHRAEPQSSRSPRKVLGDELTLRQAYSWRLVADGMATGVDRLDAEAGVASGLAADHYEVALGKTSFQ
jgi:hypothetical protein